MYNIEWKYSKRLVDYPHAVSFMQDRVEQIIHNNAAGLIWFVEHDSLYTAGTSAAERDLLDKKFPVYASERGGKYTYHGPGQRIIYFVLDLKELKIGMDLKKFVYLLEEVIISTFKELGLSTQRINDRVGVWTCSKPEEKVAALGIRVRKWVTSHGISINLFPDLEHFKGIVPCGLYGSGVTSLKQLKIVHDFQTIDEILKKNIEKLLLD